ncbi:MAG: DUF3419 family protein [Pyrinomonadaceae bacterium]
MATEQNVLGAVSTEAAATKQGILQRLFAYWFDAFVYNQIWEDPRVDIEALEIDEDSRILTISSGGCNALNYLVERPASVTAVDLNRYHIYLLRLKLTALRQLPDHPSFFNFFGKGLDPANKEMFLRCIEPKLDDETHHFWCSNGLLMGIFHGDRIDYFSRGGLYERSRNGYFLRFFHSFAHAVGLRPEAVLAAKDGDEQTRLFEKNIAPFFDSRLIRFLGKLPITMFGLGIPPQQLDELKNDLGGGNLIDAYRERARKLACDFPIDENYFAWQAFARKYDTAGCKAIPEYLKAEHFENLRSDSYRVNTAVGSVTDEIRNNQSGTFNRFVLLDAQDWMNAAVMTELWSMIAEKAEPGSRIIFRTAAAGSPLPRNLPPELLAKFTYREEQSLDLFHRDRASIYGGFHLYILDRS